MSASEDSAQIAPSAFTTLVDHGSHPLSCIDLFKKRDINKLLNLIYYNNNFFINQIDNSYKILFYYRDFIFDLSVISIYFVL